jgi:hypothetical protein
MESSDVNNKEVEDVTAVESEQEHEEDKADASPQKAGRSEKAQSKKPSAVEKKKSGPNILGVAISVLGILGLIGGVLLDPFMNIVDSSHPAAMNIGMMQMIGIAVAVLVLVAGVMITITKGKKPSTG